MTAPMAGGAPAPMRFGLVGTGHWARVTHAPAIAAAPGAVLVGVWGRREEAARALAETYGAGTFTDVDALFDAVDAVAFCVPPDVQAELATRAARAGKHLLLDKPIALTRAASDTLTEAVAAAGVRSVVFFTHQFQPDVRAWLATVHRTSDWDGATAHWLGNAFYEGSPWANSTWRREMGGLWDIGPHVVAMLLATLGPIDRVHAEPGHRDAVGLLLHHTTGATSVATVSSEAPLDAGLVDVVLWGGRGRLSMPAGVLPPDAAFGVAVRELMAGSGTGTRCDVRFGRDVVDVIAEAARQLTGR